MPKWELKKEEKKNDVALLILCPCVCDCASLPSWLVGDFRRAWRWLMTFDLIRFK